MEFHQGRLLDHVHLRVRDLDASRRFYAAALGALGLELRTGDEFFSADELWVTADGPPTERLHLAFQARDEGAVQSFHEAALAAGGTDNGPPGERKYHPGYYAAYVLDPDSSFATLIYRPAALSPDVALLVLPCGSASCLTPGSES